MKKNESGIAHLLVIVVLVVLVVVGTGVYVLTNDKPKTANSETATKELTLAEPLPTDLLSSEKVEALAAVEAPNTGLSGVQLERENGVYLYKVTLANGNTLFFNARTGTKVTHAAGATQTADGVIPAGFAPTLTFADARRIALETKPGGVIAKMHLQSEAGKVVYSVRFTDQARVDIDATTGKVVRTKAATPRNTSSASTTNDNSGSRTTLADDNNDDSSGSSSSDSNRGSGHDSNDD
jgi:uncharacterized membrane protein YkoI